MNVAERHGSDADRQAVTLRFVVGREILTAKLSNNNRMPMQSKGMAAAGKKLIDKLMRAAAAPGTSYLDQWRGGDVVMWDNRATMQRGRPWPAHEARLMVRTTISATEAEGVVTMHRPSSQAMEQQ